MSEHYNTTPRQSTEPAPPALATEPVPQQLAYRVKQAAFLLGMSTSKVHRLMTEGQIEYRKIGAATIITHAELERFISELPTGDGAA